MIVESVDNCAEMLETMKNMETCAVHNIVSVSLPETLFLTVEMMSSGVQTQENVFKIVESIVNEHFAP